MKKSIEKHTKEVCKDRTTTSLTVLTRNSSKSLENQPRASVVDPNESNSHQGRSEIQNTEHYNLRPRCSDIEDKKILQCEKRCREADKQDQKGLARTRKKKKILNVK